MRTNPKLVSATILLGVLGAVLLNIRQHEQASTGFPAAVQNLLTSRDANSPDRTPGAMPPQVKATQAVETIQTAPADASGALGTPAVATRPQVTFQNGLLQIRAENSSMGDVLQAVQRATGAAIDFPGSASEPVSVNLGPGALRDIVTSLLDGSRYDYILVISQKSKSIERIVLTARRDSGGLPPLSNVTDGGQQPTLEQGTEARQQPPVPDMKQMMEQQQLQFEKQFGACIVQGCDAS